MEDTTRSVVQRYFQTWPQQRFDEMRACLADRIRFNGTDHDADAFIQQCAGGPAWSGVTLITSIFSGDRAALLYEGIDTGSGRRMRVAEFLSVEGGKIRSIDAAIMETS